jgi:hypothetical protein
MPTPNDSNRQNRMMWIILAIVGALLCVVGWYRWMI